MLSSSLLKIEKAKRMTAQGKYVLRIEGVNLSNVIDDTDQLSVRRGGGLMILNTAPALKKLLPADIESRLTEIATGASIGLFEFEATETEAKEIRTTVEQTLTTGALEFQKLIRENKVSQLPLKHGTFVVDIVELSDAANVQQAEQLATARNRWRQLKSPTLSLDEVWEKGLNVPCTLDRTRPATKIRDINEDQKQAAVCQSTADRREYGRGARQKFYRDELLPVAMEHPKFAQFIDRIAFTNDVTQLSEWRNREENVESAGNVNGSGNAPYVPPNLSDKIAVFYVDGNGFGQKGRAIFESQGVDGYRQWSLALKEHHRQLLKGLLSLTENDPLWQSEEQSAKQDAIVIRLETLLWGGDEILWIVPAWKGWEVAEWFFRQVHEITLPGNSQTETLTYGSGLVFCHAKAPIKNVMRLAHDLGDVAKDARGKDNVHRLAYEVLESFDDISGDLNEHRQRFLPTTATLADLVIDPAQLKDRWLPLTNLASSSDFPMRQLYRLVTAWRKDADGDLLAATGRIVRACDDAGIDYKPLLSAFGDPAGWLHLLQMLPYLPTTDTRKKVEDEA